MKKLIISSILFLIMVTSPRLIYARDVIPDKVLNNFQESFPAVNNVHWYTYKNYAVAYFALEKSSCRVEYSLEGELLVVTYYLTPDLLRPDITKKIITKFPDKEIFGVTQVTKDGQTEYFIVLKDSKNWYNLKYTSRGKIKVLTVFENAG